MHQDPILLRLLSDAGLDEKGSKVYLAMLETGQATVQDIAKRSELKRPIIYVILEDLVKRGYATELPNKKIRTYQAIDPGAISAQLQTTAKNFSDMLPIFKTLANRGHNKPKITFLDTKEGIVKVFDEINRCKSAVFIASIARLEEHFPGSVKNWQRSYATGFNKLASRTIIPNKKEDIRIYREFREITPIVQVRVLPSMNDADMDICVFGNKVSITTFEDKPFMVVIESEAVPGFFRPIFDILWQSAKIIR